MPIQLNTDGAPATEYSQAFLQGMLHRMVVSYHKYGALTNAYPHDVDAVATLELRLEQYRETGNTEFLMDVANYAMIEFMHPKHKNAYFLATDSDGTPGRINNHGLTSTKTNTTKRDWFYRREGD